MRGHVREICVECTAINVTIVVPSTPRPLLAGHESDTDSEYLMKMSFFLHVVGELYYRNVRPERAAVIKVKD